MLNYYMNNLSILFEKKSAKNAHLISELFFLKSRMLILKIPYPLALDILKSIAVSVVLSGVLTLIFYKYVFGILDCLKVEKYY